MLPNSSGRFGSSPDLPSHVLGCSNSRQGGDCGTNGNRFSHSGFQLSRLVRGIVNIWVSHPTHPTETMIGLNKYNNALTLNSLLPNTASFRSRSSVDNIFTNGFDGSTACSGVIY